MIFDEQISRKPNNYPWTLKIIHAIQDNPWTDRKFTFMGDLHDLKVNLKKEMADCALRGVAAISQIEVGVKSFWLNFALTLKQPCFKDLGAVIAANEVVHNYAYERVIEVFGAEELFQENLKNEVFLNRVKYLRKYSEKTYDDDKKQFIYAVCLFTLFTENTSLFSQFYVINWLSRNLNVLKDLDNQVNYTLSEEHCHSQGGAAFIIEARKDYPELFDDEMITRIREETIEAYKAEAKLVDWILGDVNEKGLNPRVLKEYVKFKLNESLEMIDLAPIFEIDQEIIKDAEWFIISCNMVKLKDFFAGHDTGYSEGDMAITADDIF